MPYDGIRRRKRRRAQAQPGAGLWLHRDLEGSWLDDCVIQQVAQHGRLHIAHSNITHEAFAHELLHSLPGLAERHVIFNHPRRRCGGIEKPLRWVPRFKIHELERDGEVDVIHVEVVDLEVA